MTSPSGSRQGSFIDRPLGLPLYSHSSDSINTHAPLSGYSVVGNRQGFVRLALEPAQDAVLPFPREFVASYAASGSSTGRRFEIKRFLSRSRTSSDSTRRAFNPASRITARTSSGSLRSN